MLTRREQCTLRGLAALMVSFEYFTRFGLLAGRLRFGGRSMRTNCLRVRAKVLPFAQTQTANLGLRGRAVAETTTLFALLGWKKGRGSSRSIPWAPLSARTIS